MDVKLTEVELDKVLEGEHVSISPGDGSVWACWRSKDVVNLRLVVAPDIIVVGQTPGEGPAPVGS